MVVCKAGAQTWQESMVGQETGLVLNSEARPPLEMLAEHEIELDLDLEQPAVGEGSSNVLSLRATADELVESR